MYNFKSYSTASEPVLSSLPPLFIIHIFWLPFLPLRNFESQLPTSPTSYPLKHTLLLKYLHNLHRISDHTVIQRNENVDFATKIAALHPRVPFRPSPSNRTLPSSFEKSLYPNGLNPGRAKNPPVPPIIRQNLNPTRLRTGHTQLSHAYMLSGLFPYHCEKRDSDTPLRLALDSISFTPIKQPFLTTPPPTLTFSLSSTIRTSSIAYDYTTRLIALSAAESLYFPLNELKKKKTRIWEKVTWSTATIRLNKEVAYDIFGGILARKYNRVHFSDFFSFSVATKRRNKKIKKKI